MLAIVGPVVALATLIPVAMRSTNDEPAPPARPPTSPTHAAAVPAAPAATPSRAAQVVAAPSPEPAEPAAPPVAVTADQLRREYETNEVSADERYRGRVLVVTGIVKSVKKDILSEEPYVELSAGFMSVDARFDPEDGGVLGRFLRGDKIIVRCIGNGQAILSPQLRACVLQNHYRRAKAQ